MAGAPRTGFWPEDLSRIPGAVYRPFVYAIPLLTFVVTACLAVLRPSG